MNEEERRELEQLKTRQAELVAQLANLGHRLEAFERRLSVPPVAPAPGVMKPELISKIVREPATVIQPPPMPVAPPPILPPPFQPSPVPPPAPVVPPPLPAQPAPPEKEFQPRPTVPVGEPVFASYQSSAAESPTPAHAPQSKKKGSIEMRVGTYWLVRIGIVMVLTSLVFFGNYAYQNFVPRLGPGGKIFLLYLASGSLLGIGTWLQRKQASLKNYAQVLQAGGLAAVYFTTYAAHHFPNLEIIHSAVLDGVLLIGWAGFIIWLADRKKSEVLALFAVLLAYYSSVVTHAGLFTLFSNLVLTAAAVFFLVRNRWATVSFASLAATYISYAFWRFFHAGQWHWVDPSEGLWTGNYFLMGYWLLFSAAVFLSKHETFNGERRAAFLSLNNAAFFTAFLLTMLQVHQGGFWKFSLVYGTVLIGLAVLARLFLAKDKLATNAYLTQGLLLVTLGFLTRLAGLKLSLVLAVESVILLSLGQLLKSRVMQAGSLITAALAAGWTVATIQPFDRDGLLAASAVGAMMLWNAFCLCRKTTFGQSGTHLRTLFYTALSLAVWLVATWQNSKPEWRGLVVACETTALLLAARPLGNQVLRFGAYLFAGISLGWEATTLGSQFTSFDIAHRTGLAQGIILGAAMLFNAHWEQRAVPPATKQTYHLPVGFFSAMGLLAWLMITLVFTPHEYLAPLLAVKALLLTAAYYPLRLRELALFGQSFLLLAQALWLYDATQNHLSHPWWNPVIIIAVTLALAAWWQRQKTLVLTQPLGLLMQGLYAFAVVGLLFYWLEPQFTAPAWLAFASLLAILLTAYAALNRFWLLAAAGQIFLIVSGWQFCRQMWDGQPVWYLPLVPVVALCLLSLSTVQWFAQRPNAKPELRENILGIALVYRVLALVMSLWWVHKYIPPQEQVWVLVAVGLVLFLLAGWWRNQELLIFGAVFTLVGLVRFALPWDGTQTVYWPNLLAILALLAQQQLAKRAPDHFHLSREIHTAAIVLGGLSLWLLLSRWILQQTSGFYLTVGWSILALLLFVVGMALRERIYRWIGLAVLACALGRVVIFDVWKLEKLYIIFTFMALGLVLLILGFLYNKYQEKIREWL